MYSNERFNSLNSSYKDCCDSLRIEMGHSLYCEKYQDRFGGIQLAHLNEPSKCVIYKKTRHCPSKNKAVEEKKVREAKEAAEKAAREREATDMLRKAADQGDADAQYKLGQSYFTGQGETQDYAKAIEWFKKAAEQGHTEAKDFLAKEKTERDARWVERLEREAKEKAEQKARAEEQQLWQAQGLCNYCGGILGGLFTKKCKSCGKKKNY